MLLNQHGQPMTYTAMTPAQYEAMRHQIATEVRVELATEMHAALMKGNSLVSQSVDPTQPQTQYTQLLKQQGGVFAMKNPGDYQVAYDPTHHPHSAVTTDTLRRVADMYDVLRSCINHLKRELSALPMEVVPRDPSDHGPAVVKAIKQCNEFCHVSGGLGGFNSRRSHFESKLLEDLCVIGAGCVYWQKTYTGKPHQLVAVDASTIQPIVNDYGWLDDKFPYRQWIQGVQETIFQPGELTYDGIFPVTNSPFFKSPTEYLINVINAALRAGDWNLKWLTDGDTSSTYMSMPEGWTPEQTKEFIEYLSAKYSGDNALRQQAKVIPAGSAVHTQSRKDMDFSEFELWLLRRTCAIIGVSPASIGFAGEQYKVSQENSQQLTTSFGVGVVIDWFNEFYDTVWESFGYDFLETKRESAQEEDAAKRAERLFKACGGPWIQVNEARVQDKLEAIEGGDKIWRAKGEFESDVSDESAEEEAVGVKPGKKNPVSDEGNEPGDTEENGVSKGAIGTGKEPSVGGTKAKVKSDVKTDQTPSGSKTPDAQSKDKAEPDAQEKRLAALSNWEHRACNRLARHRGSFAEPTDDVAELVPIMDIVALQGRLAHCKTGQDVRGVFAEVTA